MTATTRWSVLLWVLLTAGSAQAYPWMIKHGYAACAACHVDPSGAGLLTPYGHAQHELLVTSHYGRNPEEVDPGVDLFNKLRLPAWLNLGVSTRAAELLVHTPQGNTSKPLLMIADLRGEVSAGRVHVVATLGFEPEGALLAALTRNQNDNLVSREHWVGVDFAEQSVLVRAGRMNVPFGLRNIEHPSWIRSETRTDLDSAQQYGLAVAYLRDGFRAELMGIAGNFQLTPTVYREQGYSGFAEWSLTPTFTLGASSLLTHAGKDLITSGDDTLRQAHGVFSRWGFGPFALLGEADALIKSSRGVSTDVGFAGFTQLDAELIQGIHLLGTLETLREAGEQNYGEWASVAFFLLPNAELRTDAIFRQDDTPTGFVPSITLLGQLHLSI